MYLNVLYMKYKIKKNKITERQNQILLNIRLYAAINYIVIFTI